jgi:RHS repeat-associated protein
MITNDHGDVLELIDANGNAFASYRYDPWGGPIASGTTTASTNLITSTLAANIASRQVLRYAFYAYDPESGLYYCSARYYDPTTRQWTTADSAKADGEESAYRYCMGQPATSVDPSGERTIVFEPPAANSTCTNELRTVMRVNATHVAKYASGSNRSLSQWTFDMVKKDGPWDFKLSLGKDFRLLHRWHFGGKWISAEDFGNIHFGYIGAAEGLSCNYLKFGSWWVAGHPIPNSKNEYHDEQMIAWGFRIFGQADGGYAWARKDDIFVRKGTKPI